MVRPKITRKEAKLAGNIYRGYKPPDLPQDRPPQRIKWWWKVIGKPMLTLYPQPEVEEWSEKPEYPPLNDASKAGLKRQYRLDWYESLKALPTVEQKLHCINLKASNGHHIAHLHNWLPTANSLQFTKYLCQTHLIKSLPVGYDIKVPNSDQPDEAANRVPGGNEPDDPQEAKIQQLVLDQIGLSKHESHIKEGPLNVIHSIRDGNRSQHVSNRFIEQIVDKLRKTLVCETNPQLLDYQLDLSPAIRSWWYHSGFEPPNKKPFYRSRKDEDGNVNTIFQMNGHSALNIRSEHMIEPIVDMKDPLVTDTSLVEKCNYSPHYFGAHYKFKWPVALPGFWYEDAPKYDCPHTCFLSTDCLRVRQADPLNQASRFDDIEDSLTSQAIMTAFGWLNGLSIYHGYTPFNEIHYPFTCQVVTTDGQNWLFNVFQMNAHSFHRDLGGPARNNLCWSSGLLKLYEDYQGGNFKGVNSDVISLLVKFMSKRTSSEYTSQLNLRPYLHEDDRTDEVKEKMRKELRYTFEGRNNQWLSNQWAIPEWERIFFRNEVTRYQIKHMKPKWHPPKPKYPAEFE